MAKRRIIGFALFAPGGKSGKTALHFLRQGEKVAKRRIIGFALFAPGGKSGKTANYRICAFCARGQKWQNGEL